MAGRPAVPLPTSASSSQGGGLPGQGGGLPGQGVCPPGQGVCPPGQRRDRSGQQPAASTQQRSAIAAQLVQQSMSNSQQSLYRALSQGQAAAIVTGGPASQQGRVWQEQGKQGVGQQHGLAQRPQLAQQQQVMGQQQQQQHQQLQQQQQQQHQQLQQHQQQQHQQLQQQQQQQQQQYQGGTAQQQAALLQQQSLLLAQQQPVRSQQKPVLSQQHILAQQQQQQAMLQQYKQQVDRQEQGQRERTYMNVQPVARRSRREGEAMEEPRAGTGPAIPCSQEVKHKQEPLYATILQAPGNGPEPGAYDETNGMYANYAPASLYSNYSNYSELDVLRSSDSHCSAEEEHTEGLPSLGDSPVSSSYSELRQVSLASSHSPHLSGPHPGRQPAAGPALRLPRRRPR